MGSYSLYLHLPYCLHKCPYCDFNTYAVATFPEKEYLSALISELDYRLSLPDWSGREVKTIYFGGGTPSLFEPRSIENFIAFLSRTAPISEDVEITLEVNPGTVSNDKLHGFRQAGVNRLSIGAQSFQSRLLKVLGRIHSEPDIITAFEDARHVGFRNVSLDLMYGIPEQDIALLEKDLDQILCLDPEHISIYGLTIEKGTPFYQAFKTGKLTLPEEDVVADMMELIMKRLGKAEYEHYEISNFSKAGHHARHNVAYWTGSDYLGLGAGAHSFCRNSEVKGKTLPRRWANYALPNKYMEESIAKGSAESWEDRLTAKGLIFEYFFLGLRRLAGVRLDRFHDEFGQTVHETYPNVIEVLLDQKLLEMNATHLKLTQKGLMLADSVIENFLDDEEIRAPRRLPPLAGEAFESRV